MAKVNKIIENHSFYDEILMQDRHFYMFRSMCRQYDICIFKHSKLPVERTTKSFARNSRVLSEQRYITYTQRFTSYRNQSVQS